MSAIIFALSFGKPDSISSNRAIASIAIKISLDLDIPIIADNSISLSSFLYNVSFIGPPAYEHESTINLAKIFACLPGMKKGKWDKVIIVSAPDYMWRAIRDVKDALRESGVSCEVCDWRDYIDNRLVCDRFYKWYDKNSTQLWTRIRLLFAIREIILKLMPFWLYKKVTT